MSAKDNYVSEQMFTTRITCHGKIESLASNFKLKDDQPFSLFIRAKSGTSSVTDVLVNVRLYKEDTCSPCPVTLSNWQELMVCELDASNAVLLDKYEIYWGAGTTGIPV